MWRIGPNSVAQVQIVWRTGPNSVAVGPNSVAH